MVEPNLMRLIESGIVIKNKLEIPNPSGFQTITKYLERINLLSIKRLRKYFK